MSGKPDLSVVLPTLDESDGLKVLLPRLRALFDKLGVRGEVLIVDGGSKDDTAAVAEAHGARVMRQQGRGFGSAVREGIAAAAADRVVLMDADGSHAPEALEAFWARRGDAELIVGSRYCRGGSAQMDMTRQILSRSLNLVSRRVLELPVRESSSGFRLYSGPAARAVQSGATDFSVQQDLMVGILAAGGRVIELPIHYAPRVGGISKANAWKLAPAYVRLLLRLKPRRGGWRAETGLALVLAGAACAGWRGFGGAAAAFFLAAGALCVHETIRLRGDRLAGVLAAAAWPAAALAGAPLATPWAAFAAFGVLLAAGAADSVFP
ncbi:MAG TPA: glycosyltransferase [Elusimicrobiota bacterium]|nr:glycosyltransferase [Elusimicrobiota bacterium]